MRGLSGLSGRGVAVLPLYLLGLRRAVVVAAAIVIVVAAAASEQPLGRALLAGLLLPVNLGRQHGHAARLLPLLVHGGALVAVARLLPRPAPLVGEAVLAVPALGPPLAGLHLHTRVRTCYV